VPVFGVALFLFGPLLGLAFTAYGMIASFDKIATVKSPTPTELAEGVSKSLMGGTTVALALGLTGLLVFVVWLLWFLKSRVAPRAIARGGQQNSLFGQGVTRHEGEGLSEGDDRVSRSTSGRGLPLRSQGWATREGT
jgi:hypothetical protein